MRYRPEPGEGKKCPIGLVLGRARNERALLATFWALRLVHLGEALACVLASRRDFRRSAVADGTLVAALGEAAWLARRSLSERGFDTQCAVVDATVGTLSLGPSAPPRGRQIRPDRGGLSRSHAGVTRESRGQTVSAVGNALMTYPGLYWVGSLATNLIRRIWTEVDEARQHAVERAARLATEREFVPTWSTPELAGQTGGPLRGIDQAGSQTNHGRRGICLA